MRYVEKILSVVPYFKRICLLQSWKKSSGNPLHLINCFQYSFLFNLSDTLEVKPLELKYRVIRTNAYSLSYSLCQLLA